MKRTFKRIFWEYRRERLLDRLIIKAQDDNISLLDLGNTLSRIKRVINIKSKRL
jgi:hypothetical protein